jgi:hypothetical protein
MLISPYGEIDKYSETGDHYFFSITRDELDNSGILSAGPRHGGRGQFCPLWFLGVSCLRDCDRLHTLLRQHQALS